MNLKTLVPEMHASLPLLAVRLFTRAFLLMGLWLW